MDDTFTLLPLHIDPTSKAISSHLASLEADLTSLNALHTLLKLAQPNSVPPPPLPTNPKRSAQIQKMREQGNASLRTKTTPTSAQAMDAIKLYTYGIKMALERPAWEPTQLVREEAGVLYSNRAQAYMAAQMWAEGAADGETSVWLKRTANGKAWWRRGRCLCEMRRWKEAQAWVREGLEVEGNEVELAGLMKEIHAHLEKPGN